MKIGILSDTHGAVGRTVRAMDTLIGRGSEAILHCGDIGGEEAWSEIMALCRAYDLPLHAVLGNVDEYEPVIWSGPDGRLITIRAELTLAGKSLAILHGHHFAALEQAISGGEYDYVFTGHTHQARDERVGRTRVINPGAVYRASPCTVAMLDLAADALEFITL
ncbi:MAG TPA: YfcE family phosphodiesterase [Kiritimatiellia bacterium]|nr:YfcE family phosphodiesterase [Kiritimatiellia bacterium]